jgi:hypothetical protein
MHNSGERNFVRVFFLPTFRAEVAGKGCSAIKAFGLHGVKIAIIICPYLLNLRIANSSLMSSLSVYTRFENLPGNLKQEVSDFIDLLAAKSAVKKKKSHPEVWQCKRENYHVTRL